MTPLVAGLMSAAIRITAWALLCYLLVTLLDRLNNDPFSKDKATIAQSPMAIALYRGLRWLAILIGGAIILG